MLPSERIVKIYKRRNDQSPFQDWFDGLKDKRARTAVLARFARIRLGIFGDCKGVGDGVQELRIHYGPGFRIYFGQDGAELVLLLNGGSKGSQERDILQAKECWRDYQERKKEKDFRL